MSEENKQVYSPLTNEQIKVKEILLMPIEATKPNSKNRFERKPCKITSQMLYKSPHTKNINPDPDMSDIAIKFYEIIYGIKILNENNGITFPGYTGDTLNSYKTIEKRISEKISQAPDKSKIAEYNRLIQEWKRRYHCLANFGLLWYKTTRSTSKYPGPVKASDSLDVYILGQGEEFISFHYLYNYKPISDNIKDINDKYEHTPDEVIKKMIECIELRADNIVRDEKVCNKLYDFFKEKNFFELFINYVQKS